MRRLRDDERKNPAVLSHLHAENAYTKAVMADTEALQGDLYLEMRGRIQEADQSVPERWVGQEGRGGGYSLVGLRLVNSETCTLRRGIASRKQIRECQRDGWGGKGGC